MAVGLRLRIVSALWLSLASLPRMQGEVVCPNVPGEEIPGLNGLMSTSTEGRVFRVGDIVSCQCKPGHAALNIGCIAHCGEGGGWEAHDFDGESKHICVPVMCEGTPYTLSLGRFTPDQPPEGRYWRVGERIVYTCEKGYRLMGAHRNTLSGLTYEALLEVATDWDGIVECTPTRNYAGALLGEWNYPHQTRMCIPEDRFCDDLTPEVDNARVVSVNGTETHDKAVYACLEGFRMLGDGEVRCTKQKVWPALLSGVFYQSSWMFIPKCISVCVPPDGRNGTVHRTLLTMTTCQQVSIRIRDVETCEQPVVNELRKSETLRRLQGISVVFRGDAVCVAKIVTKSKYIANLYGENINSVDSPTEECKSYCMDPCNGFQEIAVRESYAYGSVHSVKKTILKLQTRCK